MPDITYDLVEGSSASVVAAEGVYLHNLEHYEQAINELIELFKHGPRNQAITLTVMEQVQELEDAMWAMYEGFLLDNAVDDQLDILGAIVGERRQGRTNDDYRAAVRVRILVNRSDGHLEQLLAICRGLVPSATIYTQEQFPAGIRIKFSTMGTTTLRTALQMLRQAKAGGVRLFLSYGPSTVGAVDGDPLGGTVGAVDGNPLGFTISGGT